MNRDKQMAKDAENKKAQARQQYAKNKPLMSEVKLQEKAIEYVHPSQMDGMDDELQDSIARDDASK